MTEKKKAKKLKLNLETVKSLTDEELDEGRGGMNDPTLCSDPVSDCLCSGGDTMCGGQGCVG